jgi:hypothetical protein
VRKFKSKEELKAFIESLKNVGLPTTARIAEAMGDSLLDKRYKHRKNNNEEEANNKTKAK